MGHEAAFTKQENTRITVCKAQLQTGKWAHNKS